jgi:DNA-binding response OmpR family regulator
MRTETERDIVRLARAESVSEGAKVLVVAHDGHLACVLGGELNSAGYQFEPALDPSVAVGSAQNIRPDLVIVQISNPASEALELIRSLRAWSGVPILTLASDDSPVARVNALDNGADDCLSQTLVHDELLARVRALLRGRALARTANSKGVLAYADVYLDQDTMEVTRAGRRINLRRKTLEVLTYFLQRPERLVSRQELLDGVWREDFLRTLNVVEKTVADLRHQLHAPGEPRLIHTVWRLGYILRARHPDVGKN